jgi:hypothetical protein
MTVRRGVIQEAALQGGRSGSGRDEEEKNAIQMLEGKNLHEVEDWHGALAPASRSLANLDAFSQWLGRLFMVNESRRRRDD